MADAIAYRPEAQIQLAVGNAESRPRFNIIDIIIGSIGRPSSDFPCRDKTWLEGVYGESGWS